MSKARNALADIVADAKPIAERRSLSADAADLLRELILLEKLSPGTPVPERDLAEGLGISRTPMKEALRTLEAEGLIEYSPTRRPKVADPSLPEITDNIQVLGALEGLAGEVACDHASDADIGEIANLNALMHAMPLDAPPLDFFHLDMEFHARIVAAAGNAPLAKTHTQYNARLWRARFLSSRQTERRTNTLTEHDEILAALRDRDAARIAAGVRRHLESTVRNVARIRDAKERKNEQT